MTERKNILVRFIESSPSPEPGLHLVVGPREMQSLVLFSLAQHLAAGLTIHWIDAGNWFDAYGLGRVARAAQLDERKVLSHIQLARPFTAIQLTAMLAKKLPSISSTSPVIISDPMALFYDGEMPEEEVNRIFNQFMGVVKKLACPVLGLAVERKAPETRKHLSCQLRKVAKAMAQFETIPLLK